MVVVMEERLGTSVYLRVLSILALEALVVVLWLWLSLPTLLPATHPLSAAVVVVADAVTGDMTRASMIPALTPAADRWVWRRPGDQRGTQRVWPACRRHIDTEALRWADRSVRVDRPSRG